jgi:hypothetical protein
MEFPDKAYVNLEGFPIQTAIHWLKSSQCTTAVYYYASWWQSTSILISIYPIASYVSFILLLVVQTIFNCASRVILSVAAFPVSAEKFPAGERAQSK